MAYRTVMVIADAAEGCEQRVGLAAQIAREFDAALVGVAAQTISGFFYSAIADAYTASSQLIEGQQALLQEDLRAAEGHFRSATSGLTQEVEWLSAEAPTVAVINDEACRADLIVAGRRSGDNFNFNRGEGAADFLLLTGRPVLVAPPQLEQFAGQTVMIAWKDTREARRAVADALPLLHRAKRVILAWTRESETRRGDESSIGRLAGYLARHQITAEIEALPVDIDDVGPRLIGAAGRLGAGVLVAGAYGHSRVREWALGGVTDHLIKSSPVATFMSH